MRNPIVALVLLLLACRPGETQTLRVSPDGIGQLRFCEPLSRVNALWPNVRDTTIASEGAEWPAKVVQLDKGTILFESSWIDHEYVWRASTDAPSARTSSGYAVGLTVGDLLDRGVHTTVDLPEGYLIVNLPSEGVSVSIDSASARQFHASNGSTTAALPRTGQVVRLHAHGPNCSQ